MSKIKTLQLGKFYHPVVGGMEDHLYHLCNELKGRCEIQVVVANTRTKTEVSRVNSIKIIRVANLVEVFSNSICPTMPFWLRKFHSDIIHIHLPNPTGHFSYLLSRPRGKLIVMWHSDIIRQKFFLKIYKPFLLSLLKRAEKIIASSPNYIEHSPFLSKFKDKCIVIPLGIDLKRFAFTEEVKGKVSQLRKRFGERIILFVGRLNYYKGTEYLIKAMEDVEANLLIIGTGGLERGLKELAQNSPKKDRICFLGEVSQEDKVSYYHACDVFVLPSVERSEAFGIVQLEAMACGKPVVSTDLNTGVPWVNQHGVTGVVVPPRDQKALAEAINTLLANPELRKRYGKKGGERVEENFSKEMVAARVINLYYEILGKG
ncbi:MAG: glycosyltransferase [Deltaproteobacteria bacterium]|nr:glycosyltransferase [Deltaproteobacteria bacterium]